MKRIIVYVVVLAVLWVVPIAGSNIGSLQPVEVVFLKREGERLMIETDTGDMGVGENGTEALEDLKATTLGRLYLDTAEYLLFTENAESDVQQLRNVFKKSVKLCLAESNVDVTKTAKFLTVHGTLPQLKKWQPGDILPCLKISEERLKMSEKVLDKRGMVW